MKSKFSSLLIIFILSSFKLFSNQSIEETMEKRVKFPRLNGWGLVSSEKGECCGEVQSLNEDELFVKIIDLSLHPKNWQIIHVDRKQIKPLNMGRFDIKQDLLTHLSDEKLLISNEVYEAFYEIDRSWFCPTTPYYDAAPDIGYGACISTPHIHAIALELCKDILKEATSVLDIGSGSGNFTALLAKVAPSAKITGIEMIPQLVENSKDVIEKHMSEDIKSQITIMQGNGNLGFEKNAPYDVIHVAYMCKEIPFELIKQLQVGGRLLVPVAVGGFSTYDNRLLKGKYTVVDKISTDKIEISEAFTCCFVPDISK